MKILVSISLLLMVSAPVIAQDYYYSDNRKIPLERAEHLITVQIQEEDQVHLSEELRTLSFNVKHSLPDNLDRRLLVLETKERRHISDGTLTQLKDRINVHRTFTTYYTLDTAGNTMKHVMSDVFHVRFASRITEKEVHGINEKYDVAIIQKGWENEYLLRVTESSSMNTLEVANKYYEDDRTEWSLPDFYVRSQPESISDSLFSNQWHLLNTGQNDGAVPGVDINVVPAWDITTGSSDHIVAVIDDGVEDHEDFYPGQLVTGYDTDSQSDNGAPQDLYDDMHGQAVAGIIVANHNSIGVRGVAPNVRIMPVRIMSFETDTLIRTTLEAAALDTAWYRGADVMNISWNLGDDNYYDNIAQALQRAMTLGRNGRGTIVVKSAGNEGNNGNYVTFPGTVPGVLTVGGVLDTDIKAYYSPESVFVDIVARTTGAALGRPGIWTTDRHEPSGFDHLSRYISFPDGTSAAAPQASGVAALILAINPELTEQEIRTIIKQTATSYGQTDWAGHGRLNAYEALRYTIENYGATLGIEKPEVTLPFWDDMAFSEDVYLASGSTLTIDAKSFVTLSASSGTVSIGGSPPGGSSRIDELAPVPAQPEEEYIFDEEAKPSSFKLAANYPNPFNPSTVINYQLPESSEVSLIVYDIMGRRVATLVNSTMPAGTHSAQFDASHLASGVYLYRLRAGNFVQTRQMLLVK